VVFLGQRSGQVVDLGHLQLWVENELLRPGILIPCQIASILGDAICGRTTLHVGQTIALSNSGLATPTKMRLVGDWFDLASPT
jgi:hypothetical protein